MTAKEERAAIVRYLRREAKRIAPYSAKVDAAKFAANLASEIAAGYHAPRTPKRKRSTP